MIAQGRTGGARGRLAGAAAALVLLPVLTAAAAVLATDPAPAPAGTSPCAPLLVLGLRGSGDGLAGDAGMGADVHAVVDRLAGRVAFTRAGYPYDTGPVWRVADHVTAASRELDAYLAARHRRCPAERVVAIGQSEGAAVLHLALPAIGPQLAAAVLMGDPARVAGAPYDRAGGAHDGVLARALLGPMVRDSVPAALAGRVRAFCLTGDPVCDASAPSLLWQVRTHVHTRYRLDAQGVVDAAAAFAAERALAGRE
jgi:Cutinase